MNYEKKKETNTLFLSYVDTEITSLQLRKHFGQAQKTESARRSFKNYLTTLGLEDIAIEAITTEVIGGYQQWLERRGIRKNSSSCYMRALQSVYNKAVANHDGNRQGNDRKREYYRISSIAIGAKIGCVCDKNLVDDIVKCTDQKRDDTGNRIFPHQLTDMFFP